LVKKDKLRLMHQSEREIEPPFLSAGVGFGGSVGKCVELKCLQERFGACFRFSLRETVEARLQYQVLAAGGVIVDSADLANVPDSLPHPARFSAEIAPGDVSFTA